ncbi:MAG: ARPP-1 family domain-containing protein [Gammaproteobacteria bacterium]
MQLIKDTLQGLTLGHPTTFLNLTVFPLHGTKAGGQRAYVTLRESLADRTVSITEVSEGGNVPNLRLENTGTRPVLILDGEELVGAKQNRIANVTILAPAKDTIIIPVSCVEQGRWAYRSRDFNSSERAQFSDARRAKMSRVSASLRRAGTYDANQGQVWDELALKADRMGVRSSTSAMADMYEHYETRTEDYTQAFSGQTDQPGAVFAIGDRVAGLELFDSPATFGEMLPKLVRSYAIDAIESIAAHRRNPSAVQATALIDQLLQAKIETYPAVGLGTDVRLTAPGVVAGGLRHEDRLVHLAAFNLPADEGRLDQPPPYRRSMSRRRRQMGG